MDKVKFSAMMDCREAFLTARSCGHILAIISEREDSAIYPSTIYKAEMCTLLNALSHFIHVTHDSALEAAAALCEGDKDQFMKDNAWD